MPPAVPVNEVGAVSKISYPAVITNLPVVVVGHDGLYRIITLFNRNLLHPSAMVDNLGVPDEFDTPTPKLPLVKVAEVAEIVTALAKISFPGNTAIALLKRDGRRPLLLRREFLMTDRVMLCQ